LHYVRCRFRYGQELEFYGEVELETARHQWWWYGTWYSRVVPTGVRAGVQYGTALEHIGNAEFELARRHGWSLGAPMELTDDEAQRLVELGRSTSGGY
jgi:hypothetical protein